MASFKTTTDLVHLVAKPKEWHIVGVMVPKEGMHGTASATCPHTNWHDIFWLIRIFSSSLPLLLEK